MLCVNERLRLQLAERGLRSGKPGDAERSPICNPKSAIGDFIGDWVATLADGFCFFWRHLDLI